MDVYQGLVQEKDNSPRNSSSITHQSHLTGLSLNNQCLVARRTIGRKWRCNLQPRTRQERLNYCKKWKHEAALQNASGKIAWLAECQSLVATLWQKVHLHLQMLMLRIQNQF